MLQSSRGNKTRHVKVKRMGDIRAGQFKSWVQEAVALNPRNRFSSPVQPIL